MTEKKNKKIEKFKITEKHYYPKEQDIEIDMEYKILPDDEHHSHINEEGLIEVLRNMADKINEIIDYLNNKK